MDSSLACKEKNKNNYSIYRKVHVHWRPSFASPCVIGLLSVMISALVFLNHWRKSVCDMHLSFKDYITIKKLQLQDPREVVSLVYFSKVVDPGSRLFPSIALITLYLHCSIKIQNRV
mmetsp:Transcript_43160/g.101202  ORF Transcript_43160/g.101202 Transcript_43160/m.101202 type:complete len:117 (+) Transcript_43160:91-441(+)